MDMPNVAIIGGGPVGLTLARLLQAAQIPCTIFELDTSRSARKVDLQGTLDLHTATGQEALKLAGLFPKFQELSRPEGEEFKMLEPKSLRPLLLKPAPPAGQPNKPEIMRTELREMLLDSLCPDSIKWGKKLSEVKAAGDGTYDLYFQDGSVEKGFDLVVGSDGAWSHVRRLLSSVVPHYSGITMVQFDTPAENTRQDLNDLVGQGAVLAAGDHKVIWAQRLTGGAILGAAILAVPETWGNDVDIDFSDADNARKIVTDKYFDLEKWSETLRQVVLGSKDEVIVRPLFELPVGFKWDSRPGVTLIGDAAHVMTPFAGVGVNVGMEDSLELAREMIKRKHEGKKAMVTDAVKVYERAMFVRAEENATLTEDNKQRAFGDIPQVIVV